MGFHDRVALSRVLRWTSFSDRAAARRSLDAVLALDFERIIVGHGPPIESGAKAALTGAFSWL
jgi:glyoxylase-like metal-dependent hydrolase (beta-lactamase superfamily II)